MDGSWDMNPVLWCDTCVFCVVSLENTDIPKRHEQTVPNVSNAFKCFFFLRDEGEVKQRTEVRQTIKEFWMHWGEFRCSFYHVVSLFRLVLSLHAVVSLPAGEGFLSVGPVRKTKSHQCLKTPRRESQPRFFKIPTPLSNAARLLTQQTYSKLK